LLRGVVRVVEPQLLRHRALLQELVHGFHFTVVRGRGEVLVLIMMLAALGRAVVNWALEVQLLAVYALYLRVVLRMVSCIVEAQGVRRL